jgi:hypothetical protein
MSQPSGPDQVRILKQRITDEIFFALGLGRSGFARRALGGLFSLPAGHFARICARLENEVSRGGLQAGALSVLDDFALQLHTWGTENIPPQGPLLVVCNHPGAYDSLAITATIPRHDLTLVASDVGFTRALTATSAHLIYVSTDPIERMNALRDSIQHLKNGGAILLFARGDVEPDPAFMAGASETMQQWSSSIEIMLRKVPQTQLLVSIASGFILPRFARSPIIKLRKEPFHQQKMAELFQILQQLIFPRSIGKIDVNISFARPVCTDELAGEKIMLAVIRLARQHLQEHIRYYRL